MDELTGPARILIVDDEPAAIELLRHALQHPEVVASTTDPRQALQLFGEFQPDLLLLDLMMPGLDGLDVLRELRRTLPANTYLPILVVTGHPEPEMRRAALKAGASDLITKPYDMTEVGLRVSHLLQASDRLLSSGANGFLTKPLDIGQLLPTVDRFVARAQSPAAAGDSR